MRRHWGKAVIGGATGIVMTAALLGQGAVSAEVSPTVGLTVTPSTGLLDGQSVAVAGEGFVINGEHRVVECKRGSVDDSGCDAATTVQVTADADGKFTTPFTVSAEITVGGEPVDCRVDGCEIVAVFATNNGPPRAAADIEFAAEATSSTTASTTTDAVAPATAQPTFTG